MEEFEGHVRRLHANGDLLFFQEYSALRPSADFNWKATLAQENRFKNRYNNIVAYDHSRVFLTPLQRVSRSIEKRGLTSLLRDPSQRQLTTSGEWCGSKPQTRLLWFVFINRALAILWCKNSHSF